MGGLHPFCTVLQPSMAFCTLTQKNLAPPFTYARDFFVLGSKCHTWVQNGGKWVHLKLHFALVGGLI